ncbi:MAG: hypothetical protein U1F66_12170 [bacterium]
MAWERVGPGTGSDASNIYYREAGGSGRWFSTASEIPASALGSTEVPPNGGVVHTDRPPDSAPAALRDSYAAAHPPPEPTGGGTRRRPVVSASSLHDGPAYTGDMAQVADRLWGAGIDPDAYFAAHPPPAGTGAARTAWINEVRNIPAGEEGNATLRDNYRIYAAEYELNALRAKGVPVGDAYAYLRAQGLLAPGSTPDAYPLDHGVVRLGTPPGDRASALSMLPHSGTAPNEVRTTPVTDVTAALVDFGDRRHPSSDSVFGRLNAGGTTAASRTDIVRTETRRLEITNQWMDYATRPTTGTPPGLGYTPEQARGVLQSMVPPALDSSGRPTGNYDVNTLAHTLFNVSEGTTVGIDQPFNNHPEGSPPPFTPRAPSLSGGTPLRLDQPVPSYTGVPNPLTQGAINYANAHPASPPGSPPGSPAVGGPSGSPGSPGGVAMADSVTPAGARVTGDDLLDLQDRVTWYRNNGRPIPASLAAQARMNGIDVSGIPLATPTGGGGGSGGGAGGGAGPVGPGGGAGSGSGPVGSGGATSGASGPFAPVPAATPTPTRPADGPLASEWDRMRAMGFNEAEIAEYQRQHPGRDAAAINGSFLRPDGSPIPASERAAVLDRTRSELREGMLNESANGIYEAARAQNIQPPITRENARLMAEQLYRERTGSGDADPTLDRMLGVRTNVAEDVHWLAEPNHPERINGTAPPGLLARTAVHEENQFYVAARAADPNGYWNGANGRTHLRGFLSRDSGRGAAVLSDPSALREARTHATPPLGTRLAAYRAMPGDERTAIEGAVTASNPLDTPDFSRMPAAERGRAEVQWQQTVIQHNWQEATTLRAREWAVADHARDRGEAVEDRDMRMAAEYAQNMRNQRFQEKQQRENLAMNMATQFSNMGFQLGQEQIRHMNQLTLQQLQAMFAITQQLIAQGTPKPFDIVMSMLQGGRR